MMHSKGFGLVVAVGVMTISLLSMHNLWRIISYTSAITGRRERYEQTAMATRSLLNVALAWLNAAVYRPKESGVKDLGVDECRVLTITPWLDAYTGTILLQPCTDGVVIVATLTDKVSRAPDLCTMTCHAQRRSDDWHVA
jgi:hypothetical protein